MAGNARAAVLIVAIVALAWVLRTWIVCRLRKPGDDLPSSLREIRPGRDLRLWRIFESRQSKPEAGAAGDRPESQSGRIDPQRGEARRPKANRRKRGKRKKPR